MFQRAKHSLREFGNGGHSKLGQMVKLAPKIILHSPVQGLRGVKVAGNVYEWHKADIEVGVCGRPERRGLSLECFRPWPDRSWSQGPFSKLQASAVAPRALHHPYQ